MTGRRKPHHFEGRRDGQLGGCWGAEEEQIEERPSFKVTFLGTQSQEVEGGAGEPWGQKAGPGETQQGLGKICHTPEAALHSFAPLCWDC